jgi:hypothetical protein
MSSAQTLILNPCGSLIVAEDLLEAQPRASAAADQGLAPALLLLGLVAEEPVGWRLVQNSFLFGIV